MAEASSVIRLKVFISYSRRDASDFADELVEISHEQAERIIQYFRERWGPYGQSADF